MLSQFQIDPSSINEKTITHISESILSDLDPYLKSLCKKVYSSNQFNKLDFEAFRSLAGEQVQKAINIFYFQFEHWKKGRSFTPYVKTALKYLSFQLKKDIISNKTYYSLICPLCKENNYKQILIKEEKLWKCDVCLDKFKNELDERKRNLYKSFSLHSRSGLICKDCGRFLPISFVKNNTISCPFLDCSFIGNPAKLAEGKHPHKLSVHYDLPIELNSEQSYLRFYHDTNIISAPDVKLKVSEEITLKNKLIQDILNYQINKFKQEEFLTSKFKYLMYLAFSEIFSEFPEELYSYLINQERSFFPIQSKIFQKYIELLEKQIPMECNNLNGQKLEILDILDPELNLFLGISKFEAIVNGDKIKNCTKEIYATADKNYGPCFLGKIVDIKQNDISILSEMKEFSFSSITLKSHFFSGKNVEVIHFRIPSHYQISHMVFLQKARKFLVDKIKVKSK